MLKGIIALLFLIISSLCFGKTVDAILLNHQTIARVVSGKLKKQISVEILILNRDGDRFSEIQIPHSSIGKSSNIKAMLFDKNGKLIRKLKRNNIVTKSSISDFSLFEDEYIKEFSLRHSSYPYKVAYTYEMEFQHFLYLDYWQPFISSDIPTLKASLEITVPSWYQIAFKDFGIDDFEESFHKDSHIYKWTASYDGRLEHEIYAPDIWQYMPWVRAVPIHFKYENKGSLESWESYGDWQADLISNLYALPESEKLKVATLTGSITDKKEKIKILFHYLQDNTRYVNVSIETGGLKPYPASYVCDNKYGDCKVLSIYFKALLKEIGITAYYSKIKAGKEIIPVIKDFPSQQSNHIVLFIPMEKDTLWIDCTSDQAFGYIGTFIQNRNALVINTENSHFCKTPKLGHAQVLKKRVAHIKPEQNYRGYCEFENTYKGEAYEELVSLSSNCSDNKKSQIMRNYLIEDGLELAKSKFQDVHRDSAYQKISYSAIGNSIYQLYGSEIMLKFLTFSIPDFSNPEKRFHPVQIDYPICMEDSLIYHLPKNYTCNINRTDTIQSPFGYYLRKMNASDSLLSVNKTFRLNSGRISKEDYGRFYDFIKNVRLIEYSNTMVFSKQN